MYVPSVIAKECSLYSISASDLSLGSEEDGASRTTLTKKYQSTMYQAKAYSAASKSSPQLIRHTLAPRRLAGRTEGTLPSRKLNQVVDYIMANLDNRPRLERMAELVHLSPDHFARQFKAATGLAPYQFVIARRVERAQELLCGRQELSLAEVAIVAGFSDQSQLCLHFKRIAGVTPGHFRASRSA
jgi:AraC-like DNA-binding protein